MDNITTFPTNLKVFAFSSSNFRCKYVSVFTVKEFHLKTIKVIILPLFDTAEVLESDPTGVSNRNLFSFQLCLTRNQTKQWWIKRCTISITIPKGNIDKVLYPFQWHLFQ